MPRLYGGCILTYECLVFVIFMEAKFNKISISSGKV